MTRRNSRRAFTLIELLLVLVILAVLASVVIPRIAGSSTTAKIKATVAELSNLASALDRFEVDNGRFPTDSEQLDALVNRPQDLQSTWKGPYLEHIPNDKFDHPYQYKSITLDNGTPSYDLYSMGLDGVAGTEDDLRKDTVVH